MIQITFDRQAGEAIFEGRRTFGTDPYFDMCRALYDDGYPDSDAIFVDERGMPCLTVQSIHSCARRYRPTPAEAAARSERIKMKKAAK